ncbi:MAG: type II toxin-antitoxin system YafQ family toxin [Bacteroidales bacterium]|nr:type II toxin-antitoxin system YafQ family toxin [Bacteroidales bacterium]
MFTLEYTNQFKKDLKRCQKQGRDMHAIYVVINLLKETGTLPKRYMPHKLKGEFKGKWECHIQSDWLLVWEQFDTELRLIMTNTGTHAELFGK